jgi:nucleotide-binding universal stress UspA family protein
MYRVLVPVDADVDRALSQAAYVTRLPAADERVEAVLLFVFTEADGEMPDDVRSLKSASRVKSVRRARDRLEGAGVETTVLDRSGDTAADIVREAEELDADAVVLGGRKRSPVGKAVFGSTTQSVILDTDRPVVVTGANVE